MSEGKQIVRYFPSRNGPILLNLSRMRLEIISGEIHGQGMVRTFQNGETPLYENAAPPAGEAPRLFIQNLIRLPFGRRAASAKRAA